jgi:hypothetical protein
MLRKFLPEFVRFPGRLRSYVRECGRTIREHSRYANRSRFIRDFPRWYFFLLSGSSPIDAEVPWITFGAEEYLADFLTKEMKVFEYGCGGSTLYFAKKARHVVSIEHDTLWAATVNSKLAEHRLDHLVDLRVYALGEHGSAPLGDPADPDSYISSDFPGRSLASYVQSIDDFEDATFDLVMIDGRARPACIKHAVNKVRSGGLLVVDNTDRSYYWPAIRKYVCGSMHDFPGPCPFLPFFPSTTVCKLSVSPLPLL